MPYRTGILVVFSFFVMTGHACPTEITKSMYANDIENGCIIYQYTLKNCNNLVVKIITYGATVTEILVPDQAGVFADVSLGFDNIDGYKSPDNPYFGSTLGRVANRISNASFTLDGVLYKLDKNLGKDMLHGGFRSFSKVVWNSGVIGEKLSMNYVSVDGECGFPGMVNATVSFELTNQNEFRIEYSAKTNKRTPINLSNHAYFNLAGQHTGQKGLFEHVIEINADKYTALDQNSIPTGEIKNVDGTAYDLRKQVVLGSIIYSTPTGDGFDINYVLNDMPLNPEGSLRFAARVVHPSSHRYLTMFTDQPGVQLYTSNSLKNNNGKNGVQYEKYGAFCLEAQKFPDAVNHPNFPNIIVEPNVPYKQTTIYQFGLV